MNWIWENKTWLFSGLGVALVLGILRYIFKPSSHGTTNQSSTIRDVANSSLMGSPIATGSNITQNVTIAGPSGAQASPEFHSALSANEIIKQIKSLPPYQQWQAGKNYEGLKVSWPTSLLSVKPDGHVHMLYGDGLPRTASIIAGVNISENSRLKISHEDTKLQVTGTIESIEAYGAIYLRDATITFRD